MVEQELAQPLQASEFFMQGAEAEASTLLMAHHKRGLVVGVVVAMALYQQILRQQHLAVRELLEQAVVEVAVLLTMPPVQVVLASSSFATLHHSKHQLP